MIARTTGRTNLDMSEDLDLGTARKRLSDHLTGPSTWNGLRLMRQSEFKAQLIEQAAACRSLRLGGLRKRACHSLALRN